MPSASAAKSAVTLDSIIEATRQLLAHSSYNSLSMRAVAGKAGITPGAIYRHFHGKQALVDHVVRSTLEEFQLELLRAIAPLPPGSFERVAAQGAAYIRLALDRPEHFKVLFGPLDTVPKKLSELPGEGGYRLLNQSIKEAIDSGAIRNMDPDLATFFLWSRVHGIVMLMMALDFSECLPLAKKKITPLHLFDLSREILWEGFKPQSRKRSLRRSK